jgi:hypothetical protein
MACKNLSIGKRQRRRQSSNPFEMCFGQARPCESVGSACSAFKQLSLVVSRNGLVAQAHKQIRTTGRVKWPRHKVTKVHDDIRVSSAQMFYNGFKCDTVSMNI